MTSCLPASVQTRSARVMCFFFCGDCNGCFQSYGVAQLTLPLARTQHHWAAQLIWALTEHTGLCPRAARAHPGCCARPLCLRFCRLLLFSGIAKCFFVFFVFFFFFCLLLWVLVAR